MQEPGADLSCPELRAAIEVAIEQRALYAPHLSLTLSVDEDHAQLSLSHGIELGPLEPLVTEGLVAALLAQTRLTTGGLVAFRRLRFACARPGHAAAYDAAFGVPIEWSAGATELWFDRALLEPRGTDASEPAALDARTRVIEHVTRVLQSRPQEADLMTIARSLKLSSRTLRRALRDAGTSYHEVRERVLHELALHYLRATRLPFDELARKLGFVDARSFRRAFKRWTGGRVPADVREPTRGRARPRPEP